MSKLSLDERAALDELTKPFSAADGSYMESVWIAAKDYWLRRAAQEADYYAANSSTARNIATDIRRLRTGKKP